jgi:hypothetical protein
MSTTPILMVQTADADIYAPMLAVGRERNKEYCAKHGIDYVDFVGIKRGYYPWHACFNRIVLLKGLMDTGYDGWAFYVDADAWVHDLTYDVRQLLGKGAMIITPGGTSGQPWDVNDGVFLINLGDVAGREIITRWNANFMSTTDDQLRAAKEWQNVPSDQPRLQRILRDDPVLCGRLWHAPRELLNHMYASFVRQVLRANAPTIADRISYMKTEITKPTTAVTHTIAGKQSSSAQYGDDYAAEFQRILNIYVTRRTGNFLEWGAGYTTRILAEFGTSINAELFLTLDTRKDYLLDVLAPLKQPFIRGEARNDVGNCVNDRDPGLHYSSFPLSLGKQFDFIYIDGRRRMECALTASMVSHEQTIIVLHDYRRDRYVAIRALFELVEEGSQFLVLRPRLSILAEMRHALAYLNERIAERPRSGGRAV